MATWMTEQFRHTQQESTGGETFVLLIVSVQCRKKEPTDCGESRVGVKPDKDYVALGFGQIAVADGRLSIGPDMPEICSAGRDCGYGSASSGDRHGQAKPGRSMISLPRSRAVVQRGNAQALPKCDLSDRKLGLRSSPGDLFACTASHAHGWPKGRNPTQKPGTFSWRKT